MKIALIALSGIRTHNEQLTSLGLTLPGFVERGKAVASLPSLGLLTIAALTPPEHEVIYFEASDLQESTTLPACDLAALSTFTAQAPEAYELAGRFRAAGVPTVMGGLHATARPEEVLQYCDAVVVGEGELSWSRVVEDLERGQVKGVYEPDGQEFDLAQSPIPRFDLLDPDRYNRLTVQTQRGCPWHCEFCASSILLTSRYKLKPTERVIAEIRAIKALWPRPFIEFADDNSFVDKPRAKHLLRALAAEEVHWFTETDISIAEDEELLALMQASGCREVLIGFESPTLAGLEGLELKRNWKQAQIEHHKRAIERIQAHGIRVNACFVLGLDGDGPGIFKAVEAFVEETLPFDVQVTVLTPLPGTPLYDRLREEGRLLEEDAWEKSTLFDVTFRPLQMSVPELEAGLLGLVQTLYSDAATKRRRLGFKKQWREGQLSMRRMQAGT